MYLIVASHTLLTAMDREQQIAELLEQYPPPSIRNGWLANLFGCNQTRKLVHEHAIEQAWTEASSLKVRILKHVYENYFQPFNLCGLGCTKKRRMRDHSHYDAIYLKEAIEEGRDDLVALLFAHGALPNTSLRNSCYDCFDHLSTENSLYKLIFYFPKDARDQAGYEHIVTLLIDRGVRLNELYYCCQRHGWTSPIEAAIDQGKDTLVKLLVKHGADINLLHTDGHSLFAQRVYSMDVITVEKFLFLGADINYGHSLLPGLFCRNMESDKFPSWETGQLSLESSNITKMIALLVAHGAAIDGKDHFGETIFHKAFKREDSGDDLKLFLYQAPFTKTKTELKASRKCIIAALCLFNRLRLSRDMRINLLNYLSGEVFSLSHCRFLLQHGVGLQKLVPHCRMAWLKTLYRELDESVKANCLKEIVSLVTAHRLGKMKILFESQWLQDMYAERHPYNPNEHVILNLLDPNNVEQHRSAIVQKVRNEIIDMKLDLDY